MMSNGVLPVAITLALLNLGEGQPLSLSREVLQQEAIFIGSVVSRDIQQTLIPDIGFSCSGNITKWTIVGSLVGGGLNSPEIQVWRWNGQGREYSKVSGTRITSSSYSPTEKVYEVELNPPISFLEGDILGVYTPAAPRLTFKYQKRGGPLNYWSTAGVSPSSRYTLNGAGVLTDHNDYPLVAVDTTPTHCASGFIDRNTLLLKASLLTVNDSDLQYREATQRVIPEATFSENGVIQQFTVGALKRQGSRYPEIQVWRPAGSNTWNKVAAIGSSAAIVSTAQLNVYEYRPYSPIVVRAGDILGLYQPYTSNSALQIYLQDHGPANYYQPSLLHPKDTISTDHTLVHSENRQPLLALDFRPDRAISVSTATTLTTATRLIPVSPAASAHTATLSPVRPAHTATVMATTVLQPSATPTQQTQTHGRINLFIAIGTVVVFVTLSGIFILVCIVTVRRGLSHKTTQSQPSANDSCRGCDQSMPYTVNYRPQDPRHIISNGRKQAVDLKINEAYKGPDKDNENHIYESID